VTTAGRQVTTSTGQTTIIGPKASSSTITSGGLY